MTKLKSEDLVRDIIHRSCYLYGFGDFKERLLRRAGEFIAHDASGVTGVRGASYDQRAIHYGYPLQYLIDYTNMVPEKYPYWQEYFRKGPDRGYYTLSASRIEGFIGSETYKRRYEPYGFKDSVQTMFFDATGENMGIYACNRRFEPFISEEEEEFFDAVAPYVFYAYRKYRWLLNMELFTVNSPDELFYGVITTKPDGTITYLNDIARRLLKEREGEVSKLIPGHMQSHLDRLSAIACETGVGVSLCFREIEHPSPYGSVVCFNYDEYGSKYLPVNGEGVVFIINTKNIDNTLTASITRREREVIGCLVKGMTDKEIAQALYIAEKTVHNHVSSILEKLEASNRTEAASKAVKLGLV